MEAIPAKIGLTLSFARLVLAQQVKSITGGGMAALELTKTANTPDVADAPSSFQPDRSDLLVSCSWACLFFSVECRVSGGGDDE